MEDNMIKFGIPIILAAAVLATVVLRYFYKKSIVYHIGIVYLFSTALIASVALFTGHSGMIHFSWAVPLSFVTVVSVYYFISIKVQKPLHKLTDLIIKLSGGNLDIIVEDKLVGRIDEIGEIARSIKTLNDKLDGIIQNIHDSSVQLLQASNELSASAEELSQVSSEQASSVEEVSASMEEMSSNISQAAENAGLTERITLSASQGMKNGYNMSVDSKVKMLEISKEILIINEIAFQTNILALNAAVEAARAGQYGKGFAVVAAEVRRLAEKSKLASDKIQVLSKEGVTLINSTSDLLEKSLPEVEKSVSLVQEISASSIENNAGADQINKSMSQLGLVSQQSAATSEELAGKSAELSELSSRLEEEISYFKSTRFVTASKKKKLSKTIIKDEISVYPNAEKELVF